MKLILILLLIATSICMVARAQSNRSTDEARIRQIIQEEESAWNRGNASEYCDRCQEDVRLTNILGNVYDGRRAVEEQVARIFATAFKDSKISKKVQKIRLTRADIAIVEIDTEMTGYQALPPGVRASADGRLRTRLLQVMVKERGDWWIAAFHNVDVKTP